MYVQDTIWGLNFVSFSFISDMLPSRQIQYFLDGSLFLLIGHIYLNVLIILFLLLEIAFVVSNSADLDEMPSWSALFAIVPIYSQTGLILPQLVSSIQSLIILEESAQNTEALHGQHFFFMSEVFACNIQDQLSKTDLLKYQYQS